LGASDAWTKPDGVREQLGETSAAERAYVRGCEAGDTEAYAALGSLYLEQGRSHEACAAYRSAVDAGLPDVWEGLLAALAPQTPRAISAQTASRLRRTGLSEERSASGPVAAASASASATVDARRSDAAPQPRNDNRT